MRALVLFGIAAGIIAGTNILTTPASAGTAYLSRFGSGTGCGLTNPCNSMQNAITSAGSRGEVICLDKGNYGVAIILIPVTISCGDGLWEAPTDTVFVEVPGGDVVIEGLVLDRMGVGGPAVMFFSGGSLHLRRARIGHDANGHGLLVNPSGGVTLHVSDSVFYNTAGSGIFIRPTGSGYANVHVSNVKFERNANGLFVDGSGSTVGINVNVTGSVFAENAGNGIGAFSTAGKAGVTVSVKDSQITGNLTNGLGALGAAPSGPGSATMVVGSSMISANVNGIVAAGAAQIRTFGNNQVQFNGTNGAFTGSVGLQ